MTKTMTTYTGQDGRRSGLTRRAARAGGMSLAKRLIKPIPVIGTALALGLAGYEIKKKGWRNGLLQVGLDITPGVGVVKNVVELFTGDLIPDKKVNKP